jgi:hypothetical protein
MNVFGGLPYALYLPRETDSPLYKLIGGKGRTETRARGAG